MEKAPVSLQPFLLVFGLFFTSQPTRGAKYAIPDAGVLVISGKHESPHPLKCLWRGVDDTTTHVDGVKIAAQCCVRGGGGDITSCRRYLGFDDDSGCISGKPIVVARTYR